MSTKKIQARRGVRQGNTISSKLFTLALEYTFKELSWEKKGVAVDGTYPSHLYFVDDIVFLSSNAAELKEMLQELNNASRNIGLTMNLRKTNIMFTNNNQMTFGNITIQNVEYMYLGHIIRQWISKIKWRRLRDGSG